MKKIVPAILVFLLAVCLSACGNKTDAKGDLTGTLNAICSGSTEDIAYIYGSGLLEDGGSDSGGADIMREIRKQIDFEILDISINGDAAEANVRLSAPDVYQMLEGIASTMQEDDLEALLDTLLAQLNETLPTKEFEDAVQLKLVDGHWYLIPNGQLSNALTGGLIERYSSLGQDVIEQLLEDADDA